MSKNAEAKTLLQRIKASFAQIVKMDETITATTLKTTDGVEVVVDDLEIGGVAMIAGVAAAPGTYTFEDGSSITVGENGVITIYTPVPAATEATTDTPAPAPAAPAVPASAPAPAPQATAPAPSPMATQFNIAEIFAASEGAAQAVSAISQAFATGTPEERIANLELVAKALIEYNFGWEIRRAKEEQDKAAAIAVYQNTLNTAAGTVAAAEQKMKDQSVAMGELIKLCEQLMGEPGDVAPGEGAVKRTKQSFGITNEERRKGIDRYASVMKDMRKEKEQVSH